MSILTNTTFHKYYLEILPVVQANARLVYGFHRNYNIAVTTKIEVTTKEEITTSTEVYVAILMAYYPGDQVGRVLAITQSRSDGGADAGHISAVNRISGDLKMLVEAKLDTLQVGELVDKFKS